MTTPVPKVTDLAGSCGAIQAVDGASFRLITRKVYGMIAGIRGVVLRKRGAAPFDVDR